MRIPGFDFVVVVAAAVVVRSSCRSYCRNLLQTMWSCQNRERWVLLVVWRCYQSSIQEEEEERLRYSSNFHYHWLLGQDKLWAREWKKSHFRERRTVAADKESGADVPRKEAVRWGRHPPPGRQRRWREK